MEQETLEEVAERIYKKRLQDNIELSFYDGIFFAAKWQQEQDNAANRILEYILINDDGVGIALGYNSREMIEHYFRRIGYPVTEVENNNRV
jgi:hypothetical protein